MSCRHVALMGCGNLGAIVARGIVGRLNDAWKLIGVYDSDSQKAQALAAECGCTACASLDELLALRPEIVIEATAPAVLKQAAEQILRGGCDLMPLSIGAFADDDLLARAECAARETGRRVYFVSGAIGGFDVMQAAMMAGEVNARIVNTKSPEALAGAPYLENRTLSQEHEETVFQGSARQAIAAFPKNVNVAVALALATTGVDQTSVEIHSVPGKALNSHCVLLEGDFGQARIEIASKPSPDNPRSSTIAAMSVLARLKNLASPLSFG